VNPCFDCADLFSGATSQPDATTLLKWNIEQAGYIQKVLDAIRAFTAKPLDPKCTSSVSGFIDCLKRSVIIACPHSQVNDIGCQVVDTIIDTITSKALLCTTSKPPCNIQGYIATVNVELDKIQQRFNNCQKEFTQQNGQCLSVYTNVIQNNGTVPPDNMLVSTSQLTEAINKDASYVLQAVYY